MSSLCVPDQQALDAMEDDQIVHVYPQFGRAHVIDQRANCWCGPRVELDERGAVIVHEAEQ